MENEEQLPEESAKPEGDPPGGSSQAVPWKRLFAEGTAIVLSILVAFAIDAGWENLRERDEEQEILAGIQGDMVKNLAELDTIVRSLEDSHTAYARFMDATPGELGSLSDSAAVALLTPIAIVGTFNAYQGALTSALSSGKLHLLRDVRLREELGAWLGRVDDSAEEGPLVFAAADRVQDAMVRQGALIAFAGAIGFLQVDSPPELSAALSALRTDDEFINAALKRGIIATIYLRELLELRDNAVVILDLIEADLR